MESSREAINKIRHFGFGRPRLLTEARSPPIFGAVGVHNCRSPLAPFWQLGWVGVYICRLARKSRNDWAARITRSAEWLLYTFSREIPGGLAGSPRGHRAARANVGAGGNFIEEEPKTTVNRESSGPFLCEGLNGTLKEEKSLTIIPKDQCVPKVATEVYTDNLFFPWLLFRVPCIKCRWYLTKTEAGWVCTTYRWNSLMASRFNFGVR